MRLCWRIRVKSVLMIMMAAGCVAGLMLLLQQHQQRDERGSLTSAVSGPASNYRSVHTVLATSSLLTASSQFSNYFASSPTNVRRKRERDSQLLWLTRRPSSWHSPSGRDGSLVALCSYTMMERHDVVTEEVILEGGYALLSMTNLLKGLLHLVRSGQRSSFIHSHNEASSYL